MRISPYDLFVVIFYFGFLASIGLLTRKFVSDTSDYFRGGGQMLWWMTGATAFMTQFSAWSFTGAASHAYSNGPIILTIFFANALGFFINYAYFAPKFRQLRVITPIQAVRQRLGRANEQFFTWIFLPTNIAYAGIWLNGLAVFLATVFGFDLQTTIIVTGLIVLFNSTIGGAWAVVSSDFMQTLILMMIAVTTAIFSLAKIGGPVELFEQFPAENIFLGNDVNYPLLIISWMVLIFVKQFASTNNIMEASRYLNAKDSKNARYAGLMASMLFVFGPILWFIPPMVCAVYYPDLSTVFPQLGARASEASYVKMAIDTLPAGMIGLLIAGMFAATISSMDSGLNRNAGIFVKNFYLAVVRPAASEKEQMLVSKSVTVILGLCVIGAGLFFSSLKTLGLFDIMLQFGSLVAMPVTIPLIMMMVVRKTPDWSGWSTVVLGLTISYFARDHFNATFWDTTFSLGLSQREINDLDAMQGILLSSTILPTWFLFTKLFYREPKGARADETRMYWDNINTPVLETEHKVSLDGRQGKTLGTLAGGYGLFVALLFLIPNPIGGRITFILCGGFMMGLGYLLYWGYNKEAIKARRAARANRA
ncbi:MAG: transporter [Verrucomicrobiota bacterium JB022]|nr:transporter [Verrucomicrobiota bacterium JB022]